MKTTILLLLALLLLATFGLVSCAVAPDEWQGTPNPLDTPATAPAKRPPSAGVFGPPHGRFEGY